LRTLDHHVGVLAAAADMWHVALLNEQFDGSVMGAFCCAMEPMIDHILAWRRNDLAEARRMWNGSLRKLHEYVFGDYARLHIRFKVGSWLRGLVPEPFMRPPQPEPMGDECRIMRDKLKAAGCNVISDAAFDKVVSKLSRQSAAVAGR
jgi:dihydrodipicolinate synthase/N-acetylneuraminate lyase